MPTSTEKPSHPMPVESRDDLTSALADWDKYDPDASTDKIIRQANAVADAARGAAKRIADLEAERDVAEEKAAQWKYMSDRRGEVLQQAIDQMKANLARAETAERTLAEERERCATIADVFADQCDATAIVSLVIEQVAALRAKEQAATAIATAIRSGKTDGKDPSCSTKED